MFSPTSYGVSQLVRMRSASVCSNVGPDLDPNCLTLGWYS